MMRQSLALGLLLVAVTALPAVARGGRAGGGHVAFGFHSPHFAGHFRHFNNFNRFNRFNRFNGFNGFDAFNSTFNGFNLFGFTNRFDRSRRGLASRRGIGSFAPWAWGSDWGLADWGDWGGGWPTAGGQPPTMIVLAPRAWAAPPPPEAKAAVDTEAGVTVVRGPGSHHVARY